MSESATLDAATVKDVLDQVNSQPIETLNVAQSALFQTETMWPYFDRLRAEDPVHWTPASDFEPHWGSPDTTTSWRSTPIMGCSLPKAASALVPARR